MLLGHLIGCMLIAWVFMFYNVPSVLWLVTATLIAFTLYSLGHYSLITCGFAYLVFLTAYTFLCIKFIRRNFITRAFLEFFKAKLPKISDTENQAIEAGDVWWEGDIFSANIDWHKINKHKLHELTQEEKSFLNNETEEFCELLNDWKITHEDKDLSPEAWQYIKQNKFFAIAIPKKYGGLGFSATAQSCIVTKIATKSVTAAVTIMVPNALGPAELLIHYGTDQQKKNYLPRLATADEIPCFALTSLYAGSDAGGMTDTGIVCEQEFQGKKTLGIKLNFNKRYITLAPVATVMGLAFKMYDPNGLYSNKKDLGVTLALIPTNLPGLEIGRRHYAMFTPFQNGPIVGRDVFIPMDYIIGGADYIGKGWFMLMECLSGGRGISLPALSAATTQSSYLSTSVYSSLRRQFKTPIAKLEGIQEQLARLSGVNYITNAVIQVTCSAIDHDLKPAVVSAMAKYHCTEFARESINRAMDVHAGKGIMAGPNNYLTSIYMGSPVGITVEGANILTRNLIIFGQGAFRAHPYVLQELTALSESNKNVALNKFDKVLFKHIRFVISNVVRSLTYTLQNGLFFLRGKQNWLETNKKDVSRLACSLALATDVALLFIGGKLKFKERMSARLGDVASNIYMAMCVVKVHHEMYKANRDNVEYLQILELHTKWALQTLIYNAEQSLSSFIINFPIKSVRTVLKALIIPFGCRYQKPDDILDQKMAISCSTPNGFYHNMTELCYKDESLLGRLNAIFYNSHKLLELNEKIDDWVQAKELSLSNSLMITYQEALDKDLITIEEFNALESFAKDIDGILNVDDFESLTKSSKQSLNDQYNNEEYYQVS